MYLIWDIILEVVVYICIALVLLGFLGNFLRKRIKFLDEKLAAMSLNTRIPDRAKWWFMLLFSVPCIFIIVYCQTCEGGDLRWRTVHITNGCR